MMGPIWARQRFVYEFPKNVEVIDSEETDCILGLINLARAARKVRGKASRLFLRLGSTGGSCACCGATIATRRLRRSQVEEHYKRDHFDNAGWAAAMERHEAREIVAALARAAA